jgi:predicted Rossmann-fold nucleotide-binding protein
VTKEIVCDTLFERIDKLIEIGDGFVVLQGGTGTLLELAAVWEYFNSRKSVVLKRLRIFLFHIFKEIK